MFGRENQIRRNLHKHTHESKKKIHTRHRLELGISFRCIVPSSQEKDGVNTRLHCTILEKRNKRNWKSAKEESFSLELIEGVRDVVLLLWLHAHTVSVKRLFSLSTVDTEGEPPK